MALNIEFPSVLSILGACKSGKSYLAKFLVTTYKKQFNNIIVFTSTGFTKSYDFIETLGIKSTISGTINIDKKITYILKLSQQYIEKNHNPKTLIIFDDVMGSIKSYSEKLKQLLSTYRHYNISVMFISQYSNAIPTYIRELSGYIFIFNQESKNCKKLVHESYFMDVCDKLTDFINFFNDQLKVEHSFYFVDRINKNKFVAKCP